MEQKYYLNSKDGFLLGLNINYCPEGGKEITEETFQLASTFMGQCPLDKRVAVTDELTFSYVPIQYSLDDQRLIKINQARQYLNSTDWYYARQAETGESVPPDVVQKRVEAREFIRLNDLA